MERLLAWLRGEEPIHPEDPVRHDAIVAQLETSRAAQEEAERALDDFERAMIALRRRPFPVSDAMRWRNGRE